MKRVLSDIFNNFKNWWENTITFTIFNQVFHDLRSVIKWVYPILILISVKNLLKYLILFQIFTITYTDQLPSEIIIFWIEGVIAEVKLDYCCGISFSYMHNNLTYLVSEGIIRKAYPPFYSHFGILGQIILNMGNNAWIIYPVISGIYIYIKSIWYGFYPPEVNQLNDLIILLKQVDNNSEKHILLNQILELFEFVIHLESWF